MNSKLQNQSTSGSQYFNKRFPSSDPQQNYVYPNNFSVQKSSNITQKVSQIVSEYQIFNPSKLINQPQSSLSIRINEPSCKKENIFLNTNYDSLYKNKPDRVCEKNVSKNTVGPSYKQVSFQNDGIYSSERFKEHNSNSGNLKSAREIKQSRADKKSLTTQKQNFQQFDQKKHEPFEKAFNNTNFLQPITLVRTSSEKKILTQSIGNSRVQEISILDKPHQILDHIHFSIAHESDFIKVFKLFAAQEQEKITQRFRGMIIELQNTLREIKIIFDKKIDQTYQTLLYQLKLLKDMAEIMWKNKRGKSFYKNEEIGRLSKYEITPQKENQRPQSKSIRYLKFSQLDIPSRESNNFLLKQIYEQDQKLNEYKMTERLYKNDSEFDIGQINREKLLRDMHSVSKNIATIMKESQGILFQELFLQNRDKKKGFQWFNGIFNSEEKIYSHEKKSLQQYPQLQNISCFINAKLQQVSNFVDVFRSNLKHKYLRL